MSPVEEVKSRLDIVDVIGEYFPLKPAGANFRARCPFHEERTPSFMVSKPKQIWHCFGCGEGGDIISFVMKQEGLEFPDALKLLADKAGVQLKVEDPSLRTERQRFAALLEAAVTFWSEDLLQPSAEAALRYLTEQRKLQKETIRAWRLGYAPDSWEALINHLAKLGYKENEMISCGVAVRKMETRGRGAYDRFRNRVIFPIANAQGQIVGASGRTLSASATEAKYVNTPETSVYHKGLILYGLDKAKTAIKEKNLAVVVEGNMDVIASHQAGVTNTVASSGTALTSEQVRLLKRYTENLAFAFDADTAGESATMRGLMIALAEGCQVSLIRLPVGADGHRFKDPDECVKASPELWRQAVSEAEPMLEHYFNRAAAEYDMTKLADKQSATKLILSLISRLPDPVAFSHYLKKLSNLVGVPELYLRESLPRQSKSVNALSNNPAHAGIKSTAPSARDGHSAQSERLLAALISVPEQTAFVAGIVAPEMLTAEYAPLYRAMVVFYTEKGEDGKLNWLGQDFADHIKSLEQADAAAKQLAVLSLLADKEFADLPLADLEREILAVVNRLKKLHLKGILQKLENDIRTTEHSAPQDKDRSAALFDEFKAVSAELSKIDNPKNGKK